MRTGIITVCAIFAAVTSFAAAPGVIRDQGGETHKGLISWSIRDKAYVVSNKGVELQVKATDVDEIDIVKPAGYDAAVERVEKGQPAGAIPVLQKIVKDYAHLQWDKRAGRYLAQAYIATEKADAAYKICQDIIRTDETAAYKGELAPAFWSALLSLGKSALLEQSLNKALKTGDRFSSASALTMRGDMIWKDGNETAAAAKKALTDGYLRVVLLYREDAVAPKVRPEALYKAARCFEKMGQAGRAEAMRSELKKLYGDSAWATK